MNPPRIGSRLRIVVILSGLLACLLPFAPRAHASDWAWTQGQGWSQGTGVPKDTPSQQYRHAYDLEMGGQFLPAAQSYFLLVQTFPHSDEAAAALQRLARCLFHMENYYTSFKAIEQVLLSYPRFTRNKADLIRIQYLIGERFLEGARVNPVDSNEDPRRGAEAAVEIFQAVVRNDPFGPHAGPSLLALGDTYRKLGKPREAQDQYNRVINEFSANEYLVDQARIGLQECAVMLGEASVRDAVNVIRDHAHEIASQGRDPEEVRGKIETLQQRVSDLEEADARKLMDEARFYNRRGTHESRKSARWICERILEEYPGTAAADEARAMLATITIPSQRHRGWRVPLLRRGEEDPTFQAPGPGVDHVTARPVDIPIPGIEDAPRHAEAVAGPRPRTPPLPTTPVTAPPTGRSTPPVMEASQPVRPAFAPDDSARGASSVVPPTPVSAPVPGPAPVTSSSASPPPMGRDGTPPVPPGGLAPSAIPATLGRQREATPSAGSSVPAPSPSALPTAPVTPPPPPAPVTAPPSVSPASRGAATPPGAPPPGGVGAMPRGRVSIPDEMNP